MGALLTLNLGFFKKLIFLFIFSIILKLAYFSDSFNDYKYAGLLFDLDGDILFSPLFAFPPTVTLFIVLSNSLAYCLAYVPSRFS
jgi:hypothetical protein